MNLEKKVFKYVNNTLLNPIRNSVRDSVSNSVQDSTWDSTWDSIWNFDRDLINSQMKDYDFERNN